MYCLSLWPNRSNCSWAVLGLTALPLVWKTAIFFFSGQNSTLTTPKPNILCSLVLISVVSVLFLFCRVIVKLLLLSISKEPAAEAMRRAREGMGVEKENLESTTGNTWKSVLDRTTRGKCEPSPPGTADSLRIKHLPKKGKVHAQQRVRDNKPQFPACLEG